MTSSFSTRLRSWLLVAGLSGLLLAIGAVIGGGTLYVFVALTVIFNVVMYWFSDRIALRMSRAQPVSETEAPGLYQDVRELTVRAGLPMPRLYLIPADQPNAFATGRNPSHSAVAVTRGLLTDLPREQVRGVLAHELAHIKNRDVLVATIAAVIAGAIAAIANVLQFSLLFGGSDDDDNPLGLIGTLAAIIVAPLAAMILQLAVSRQREYLADATGARLLGEGRPLADALQSIHALVARAPMAVNPATEALYIANPLSGKGVASLFSTHPPMEERVRRLRALDLELAGRLAFAG
ncbi:MAG: zinc metalloprotease HtpX [Thermoleophilia bacterium]|nr:zinc metalloprotease HtpX [Thermoleophilia bacterium]